MTPERRTFAQVHYESRSQKWETPQWLFDRLHSEFNFTLDVCAESSTAKCEQYFTICDNALNQKWAGVCWMNPPYNNVRSFMRKAMAEAVTGCTVVALVPARTDTTWWWETATKAEVRFLKGRLRFSGSISSAPFPSAVVIFHPGMPADRQMVKWDHTLSRKPQQLLLIS